MDEMTRRALEAFREAESALGINRRRMREAFEATQTVQARAALEAFKASETVQARAAREAFKAFETVQARATLDLIRNMPEIPRPALDAVQRTIDRTIRAAPFLDAIRENERQIASLFHREHAATLDAIRAATESFQLDAVRTAINTFDRLNLAQLGSIAGSAGLAALSFNNPALESVFRPDSFAKIVADSVRSALQAHTLDASAFEGLEEIVEERIAELPRDKITANGVYAIIRDIVVVFLALVQAGGVVYQIYDGKQQAAEQNKQHIEEKAQQDERWAQALKFLKQTADNTAKLVPEKDPGKYYVVQRDVVLRLKPQSKAAKIVVLFPNQRVLLMQENHKWIYIQYFDYLEGIPRYGWAMKKYFRRSD
jgi:hypothetical protein